jgi:hypothetical protein
VIPVFPHYWVSLDMPGRYSTTFRGTQLRLELFPCGVDGKLNPTHVLLDTFTRHTVLLIFANQPNTICVMVYVQCYFVLDHRVSKCPYHDFAYSAISCPSMLPVVKLWSFVDYAEICPLWCVRCWTTE